MVTTTPPVGAAAGSLPADCKSISAGVAFFDLSRLPEWTSDAEDEQVAGFFQRFYALADATLAPAGVRIVKFMGDAGLCVFPKERADDAVAALCELTVSARRLAAESGFDAYLNVNVHAGPVLQGTFGAPGCESLDVIGKTVNIAARLGRRGVTLSAQAFRLLGKEARVSFDKIKPPITYRFRGRQRT
jgi:class 3 adenylate cyclase